MAAPVVTNTFVANTTAQAGQVNTNFSDLVTYLSNRNDGTSTWDRCLVTSSSSVPFVANNSTGTSNIANFQDNGTNVFQILDGGSVIMNSGNRLFFDGGGDTHISEVSANVVDIFAGGTSLFRVSGGASLVQVFAVDFTIPTQKKFYLDGGSNTYLWESAADTVDLYTGATFRFRINGPSDLVQVFNSDFTIQTTKKLYLDGFSNTYITESSGDQIDFVTGATLALSITASQVLDYRLAAIALGGGAGAALGTIGGSGPATNTQNSWVKIKVAGVDSYIPIWR